MVWSSSALDGMLSSDWPKMPALLMTSLTGCGAKRATHREDATWSPTGSTRLAANKKCEQYYIQVSKTIIQMSLQCEQYYIQSFKNNNSDEPASLVLFTDIVFKY